MASERQTKLAALVAKGVPGPAAMLQAGWPVSTAVWLGRDVGEYLRKAGLMAPPEALAEPAEDPATEAPMVAAAAADEHPTAAAAAPAPKGRRAATTKDNGGLA